QFYFMEMNTRIQVEHTVSEEWTGIDLLREQIRVAQGEHLGYGQEDIRFSGHVMQFRINAENPAMGFMPSPGKMEYFVPPGGPHVRVDSACYSGYTIPPHYDSMIAKLIVKGRDREDALAVGRRALREFHIGGIHSTIPFHLYMLGVEKFRSGRYDLNFIDTLIEEGCTFEPQEDL
ncbi:MAG: acetyl-CoA carboxylase biotin carboxylase subunit, partial [Chlamydiia bacterium]|nr:acetyl-CoA carboxylase biotin carboxylase subunit [Chlamydiia bacterium]